MVNVQVVKETFKVRTVTNVRRNGSANWLKMEVNELFDCSRFTIAARHNGSVRWKNVWNGPSVIRFVYFRKRVKVSGTWISRRNQEAVLTFRNEALVKHVVDCASDEGSDLKVNWSRKRFVKAGVVKLSESFLLVVFMMLKDKFATSLLAGLRMIEGSDLSCLMAAFSSCEIGMFGFVCLLLLMRESKRETDSRQTDSERERRETMGRQR